MSESAVMVRKDNGMWEQLVMGEVLIPDTPNVYGDIYTASAIRDFCYEFARLGYGIDVNHDRVDVSQVDCYVVESFIARKGDPDFVEGAWVVGTKIVKKELWEAVLRGDIAGYSFEAICTLYPVLIQNLRNRQVVGRTEPDPMDGHTHDYVLMLGPLNTPVAGATGITNGHSHRIVTHTVTEVADNEEGVSHLHRFQVNVTDEGEEDAS